MLNGVTTASGETLNILTLPERGELVLETAATMGLTHRRPPAPGTNVPCARMEFFIWEPLAPCCNIFVVGFAVPNCGTRLPAAPIRLPDDGLVIPAPTPGLPPSRGFIWPGWPTGEAGPAARRICGMGAPGMPTPWATAELLPPRTQARAAPATTNAIKRMCFVMRMSSRDTVIPDFGNYRPPTAAMQAKACSAGRSPCAA